MKTKIIASMTALLLASLSVAQAQTTIAAWTFENDAVAVNNSPVPSTGSGTASSIGMDVYPTPNVGVTTDDVVIGKTSDTGANGVANTTHTWRVRAQAGSNGAANGWSSAAPIGAQGAVFAASTVGFNNSIIVTFDWYATTQGEANLLLQYTTDGSTWINAPINIGANASLGLAALVNSTSANTVMGPYISNNLLNNGSLAGQDWFTGLTATITDAAAFNNVHFAIRLVNASTSADCVSAQGTALNNNSGNWRFDNIIIAGTSIKSPPTLSPDTSGITVLSPSFTITFPSTPAWTGSISVIKINSVIINPSQYTIFSDHITFLNATTTAGSDNIDISATPVSGYSDATVSQYIAPGPANSVTITMQPSGPTGNGGTLVTNPVLTVYDIYNNTTTNCGAIFTANIGGGSSGPWGFGTGSGTVQALSTNGTAVFTNLSATSPAAVPTAVITFNVSGSNLGALPASTNSSSFGIPAPATSGFTPGNLAVYQVDNSANNSTFSIVELSPNIPNQSSPVNIFPISATGTNAMRTSNSGSTGRLATSADGALVCFAGFLDGSSATADETTILPRGAGTLDPSGHYVLQATYMGISGNQARSATTLDNSSFYMGDKGGVYTNDNYVVVSGTGANVRPLKCFGGKVYTMTQSGSTQPTVLLMNYVNGNTLYPLNGFPVEPLASDFYMVASGQNGNTNDILYYIDPTNATSGAIFKFCLSYDPANEDVNGQQGWVPAGQSALLVNGATLNSAPTPNGGDGLCAATNASGGVDLYYTTGTGSTTGNSLIKVTDSAGYGQAINLGAFQTNYTAPSNIILKGVAFAPVAHTLTAAMLGGQFVLKFTAATGMSFSVLSTTNIAAPRSSWPVMGQAVENPVGSGNYQYTNPAPTKAQQFYIISQP